MILLEDCLLCGYRMGASIRHCSSVFVCRAKNDLVTPIRTHNVILSFFISSSSGDEKVTSSKCHEIRNRLIILHHQIYVFVYVYVYYEYKMSRNSQELPAGDFFAQGSRGRSESYHYI